MIRWYVHDPLVEAGLRFDVQPYPLPHQAVLGRPRLPLVVALCRPLCVVGGEVVALLIGQEGDSHDGYTRRVQLLHDRGALGAKIGEHEGDVGTERLEIFDDRGVGE